jgi:hypothetical protein
MQWHHLHIDFIKRSFANKEVINLLQTHDLDHHMNIYIVWELIRYNRLTFPYDLKFSRQVSVVEKAAP